MAGRKNRSEQLLEAILKELDLIIKDNVAAKKSLNSGGSKKGKESSGKGGATNNVNINIKDCSAAEAIAILCGLGAIDKSGANKKEMSSLLNSVKDIVKADPKKIKEVSAAIKDLCAGFSEIKVEKETTTGFNALANFLLNLSKLSIKSIGIFMMLQLVMSPSAGRRLSRFIKEFDLGSNKGVKEGIEGFIKFADFLEKLTKFKIKTALKSIDLMAKKLDQEKGLAISGFMIALISGIQNPKDFKAKFDALANAIYTLGVKVNPLIATSIWLASKLLTKKTGDALAKFIDALIKPLSEYKPKTLEAASKVIESIGKMLLMISAAIGIITVLVMMDLKSTLIGAGIVVAIIGILLGMATLVALVPKKMMLKGIEGIQAIGKAAFYASAAIAIIALCTAVFGIEGVLAASKIVVGIIVTLLGMARLIASDADKSLPAGIDGLEKIAKAAMWASLSIGIIALLIKIFDIPTVLIGVGIVVVIIGVLIFLVAKCTDDKGELTAGVKGLKKISRALLLITASIAILTYLVSLDLKATLIGTGIVVSVILILMGIMLALAKWGGDKDQMNAAKNAMFTMAMVLAIVAAVALFLLIPIALSAKDALIGAGVTLGIIVVLGLIVALLSHFGGDNMTTAMWTMLGMSAILGVVSLITFFLLIPIGQAWGDAAIGAAVVLGIIAVMGLIVWGLLAIFDHVGGEKGWLKVLGTLGGLTLIVGVIALITKFLLIPIGEAWAAAAAGAAVVLGIIAVLGLIAWGMLEIMNGNPKKGREPISLGTIAKALVILGGLALIIWGISELTINYLIPIGKVWKEAALGAGVVLSIILIMTLIAWAVTGIVKGNKTLGTKPISWKDLAKAGAILEGMVAILFQVAYITDKYLIHIGEYGKDAIIGALDVEEIIVALTAVGLGASKIAQYISLKDMGKAALILEAMVAVLFQVAYITETYLIDIGHEGEAALIGGGIVELLIISMTAIVAAVGLLLKIPLMKQVMAEGAIVIAGIGAIFFVLGETMAPFIDLSILVGKNSDEVIKGSEVLGILLGAMLVIVGVVGGIIVATGGVGGAVVVMGAAVIAGVGLVFLALGETMPPFIELAILTGENADAVVKGAEILGVLLGVMLGVVTAVGAIVTFTLGVGAVVIESGVAMVSSVGLVFLALGKTMPPFIELCIMTGKNEKEVNKGKNIIEPILDKMMDTVESIGLLCAIPFVSGGMEDGVEILLGVAEIFGELGRSMPSYIKLCIMAGKEEKAVLKGDKLVMRLLDGMIALAEKVGDMTGFLFGSDLEDGIELLAELTPMIRNLSNAIKAYSEAAILFAKVDMQKAGPDKIGKLLDGWTSMVSSFVAKNSDKDGFFGGGGVAAASYYMSDMQSFMGDLAYTMKAFAITTEAFKEVDLAAASEMTRFIAGKGGFVDSINKIMTSLGNLSKDLVSQVKFVCDNIYPVFDMLKNFMDIVLLYANMKYPIAWNEQGEPIEYEKMTDSMFVSAAASISWSFSYFLQQLQLGFEGFDLMTVLIINLMKDSIAPIMEGVKAFMDTVIAVASAQVACAWDEKGNPIDFIDLNDTAILLAAVTVSDAFCTFIEYLEPRMRNMSDRAAVVIAVMGQGLGGVMEGVSKYVDAILMFVKGEEVENPNPNGEGTIKTTKPINPDDFKAAGKTIADSFIAFVDALMKFNSDEYASDETRELKGTAVNEGFFHDETVLTTTTEHFKKAGGKIGQIMESLQTVMELINQCSPMVDNILSMLKKVNEAGLAIDELPTKSGGIASAIVGFVNLFMRFSSVNIDECKKVVDNVTKLKQIPAMLYDTVKSIADMTSMYDNFIIGISIILKFASTFTNTLLIQDYGTSMNTLKDVINPLFQKFGEVMLFFASGDFLLGTEKRQFDHNAAYKNGKNVIEIITSFTDAIQKYVAIQNVQVTTNVISSLATSLIDAYDNVQQKYANFTTQFSEITRKYNQQIRSNYEPAMRIAIKLNEKMYKSLVDLDNELIDKDALRNKALKEFAKSMDNVATAIEGVNDKLQGLDANGTIIKDLETRLANLKTEAESLANTLTAASSGTFTSGGGVSLTVEDIKNALDGMELRKSTNGYSFEKDSL